MMARSFTCMSMLGFALLMIAGCGASSGGGSVSGGSGNDNSTTVTFAITGAVPTAVATKVGSGVFSATTPVSGKVILSLPGGTTNFAVAFVCPVVTLTTTQPYQQTYEFVYEASMLDGTSFSGSCPATSSPGSTSFTTATLTGSVDASAIQGASYMNINAVNGTDETTVILGTPSGNFSFAAPVGTDDVQLLAYSTVVNGLSRDVSLVGAKVLTGQIVPGAVNGGSTVVLGAGDQSAQEPITYNGVPSGYSAPSTVVTYEKGNGNIVRIASASTSQYPLLPAGILTSGGYYSFIAVASKAGTNSFEETLIATNATSAGPQSFTFPPEWSYAGPTAATWPSFDLAYTGFSGKTGVLTEGSLYWSPASNAQNLLQVAATQHFLGGSTILAVPDLSGQTGFLAAPASGMRVQWSAAMLQANFPLLQTLPSNGTYASVLNSGNYTAP